VEAAGEHAPRHDIDPGDRLITDIHTAVVTCPQHEGGRRRSRRGSTATLAARAFAEMMFTKH
jgi:hypothetical protein